MIILTAGFHISLREEIVCFRKYLDKGLLQKQDAKVEGLIGGETIRACKHCHQK